MPRLYVIPSEQPNAFATGRSPKHSAVAVTEGLMRNLPREQVRGVLAHELAHVLNRDVLVTTVAAMIGAAITAVAHFLQFSWLFGGDEDDSPLGIVGTLAAILDRADRGDDPAARRLAAARVSRRRDRGEAARRGATARLRARVPPAWRPAVPVAVNPATASLYIANPLSGQGWLRCSRRIRRWRRGSSASGRSIERPGNVW